MKQYFINKSIFMVILWSWFIYNSECDPICIVKDYKAECSMQVLEEKIHTKVFIHHCHVPVDITFHVSFQFGKSKRHDWEYTFVTTNQNERILIPGLLFPSDKFGHDPVYLYVRVQQDLDIFINQTYITIEGSYIAKEKSISLEFEFLNHTIIPVEDDCKPLHPQTKLPLPWIIGGASVTGVIILCVMCGVFWYNKQKLSLDELALVSSLDVGLPGAQPYQMGEIGNRPNGPDVKDNEQVPQHQQMNGTMTSIPSEEEAASSEPTSDNQPLPGRRGFRFGRLKEDPEEMRERAVAVCDASVVIGNPIFQNKKKKNSSNVIVNKSIKNGHKLKEPSEAKPVLKKKSVNKNNVDVTKTSMSEEDKNKLALIRHKSCDSNGSTSNGSSSTSSNDTVKHNNTNGDVRSLQTPIHPLEDRFETNAGTGQGARPKLRISSSESNGSISSNNGKPVHSTISIDGKA